MISTVVSVIRKNLETLDARLPSIRDGDRDAIHDSRVATRRVRAALPLLGKRRGSEEWSENAAATVKTLGRALGKAREKDAALALLDDIERRSPGTAPAAAVMRVRLLPERLRHRRRLIKVVESVDLDVLARLHAATRRESHFSTGFRLSARIRLAAAIAQSVASVREKVHHASGVYFPNRAHHARIAIKKLRYAAELIDRGEPVRKPALRALKEAQEKLGRVHDREMLLRRLMVQAEEDDVPGARDLARVLEAESRTLFEEYCALRPVVADACDSLEAWARRAAAPRPGARLLLVGAVALPSAAVFLASRARRAG